MVSKKLLFYFVWLIFLSFGPITVLKVTPFSSVVGNKTLLVNFFQRILGLLAFSMLFVQIILGAFMQKWIDKLGAWIFRFHIMEGLVIYSLVFAHPLFFVLFNYFIKGILDPFYVYVDVCALCKGSFEWFYNFGRIGFWLITTAVLAGLFRASTPFMRIHWRKFHILNYIAFFFIWYHSLRLGTDIGTAPFSYIYHPALIVVLSIVIFKVWNLYHTSRGKVN